MTRILVLRFSSIGDIVLTTPVVRCLKEHYGNDCQVDFLTKDAYRSIVESNPYLNKVYSFGDSLNEVLPRLKSAKYDHVVDLHKNIRTSKLKRKLGVKSTSFPKLNKEKWVAVNLKKNNLPKVHVVDRYFEAVEPLRVKNDGKGLDYFIPSELEKWPVSVPEDYRSDYIAIAVGAAHATKQYPANQLREVCGNINKKVVLIGGEQDVETGKEISQGQSHVLDLCGQLSVHESAWVIKNAAKVITNDTGMMHIAAAFKKDIISVWGNTIPEFGMYPYLPEGQGSSVVHEVRDLSCRPCSKIGFDKCPKGHFKCMMSIDPKEVAESVLK